MATINLVSVPHGTATAERDLIIGTLEADIVFCLNGNDAINGSSGHDLLSGNQGNGGIDTFILQPGGGADYIVDFIDQRDKIRLAGGLSFDQITISTVDKKSIQTIPIAHTKVNDITITIAATGEVIGVIQSSVLGVSEDLTPFNFDQSDFTFL